MGANEATEITQKDFAAEGIDLGEVERIVNPCRIILQEMEDPKHSENGWFFPMCVGKCPAGKSCRLESQKGRAGIIFYRCICR